MVSKWVAHTIRQWLVVSLIRALMLSASRSPRCSRWQASPYKLEIYCSSNRDTSHEIRSVREDLTPLRHKIRLTINYMSRVTQHSPECEYTMSLLLSLALASISLCIAHSLLPLMLLLMDSTGTGTERVLICKIVVTGSARSIEIHKVYSVTHTHTHTYTR